MSSPTTTTTTTTIATTTTTTTTKDACPATCERTDFCVELGDGRCDVEPDNHGTQLNTAACNWDGGDCCVETCQSHGCSNLDDYLCRDPDYVSYVVNYCPNPHCVRDDFCIGFRNGVCDNEPDADGVSLNSDVCDWDGGDCCQITCSAQNCSSNPADYPIEQCLDPEPIELEIIISVVVAAVVVGIAVTVVVVVYLKQRMKRAVTRARDAKRIITLVEDTAYSIPFHHLKIGKLLAAGGAGQVYEGTFSGQPVAIKELFSVLFDPGFLEDLKAEAAMLASLHHPNIVRFYGLSSHETDRGTAYYLVTQLQKQTLRDVLRDYEPHVALKRYEQANGVFANAPKCKFNQPLSPRVIFKMLKAIAETLQYLHSVRIIHRDLKPENILLDKDFEIYLCDFGIAKKVSEAEMTSLTTNVGTAAYMAPEMIRAEEDMEDEDETGDSEGEGAESQSKKETPESDDEDTIKFEEQDEEDTINFEEEEAKTPKDKRIVVAGKKIDVYAFAMLGWALLRWRTPFAGQSTMHILSQVAVFNARPETKQITELWGKRLTSIITQSWNPNPQSRPSMKKIVGLLNKISPDLVVRVARKRRLNSQPAEISEVVVDEGLDDEDTAAMKTRRARKGAGEPRPKSMPALRRKRSNTVL